MVRGPTLISAVCRSVARIRRGLSSPTAIGRPRRPPRSYRRVADDRSVKCPESPVRANESTRAWTQIQRSWVESAPVHFSPPKRGELITPCPSQALFS